jgi:D-inositol-3-phosphate glycosyltransferase
MPQNPLRIAMISYHTCPLATLGGKNTGGMNVYVRELTHHLGRAGVHVDVFTRSENEHVPHVLHDLGYGNRVVHIPAGPEYHLPKEELVNYIPQFVEGILDFARDKDLKYDLIHSHYWMSGIASIELQKAWHTPIISMFHTLQKLKNQIARSDEEREGLYRIEGEERVIQYSDRIVAATPAEETQLTSLYHTDPDKLCIIPPGVDTSRFYPIPADEAKDVIGIPAKDRMLLFVGRIEPLKGVDTLVRAIAHMRSLGVLGRCPHYLAVIGGEPTASPENMDAEMIRLQELCKSLGIGDLVVFLGKRDQNLLPYYYSASEVVIMPSRYESFGMVALEAMACGIPVVASQVGGLAYLVQDNVTGVLVPDGDPIILGETLTKLIRDSELRGQLGLQANLYSQDFSWDIIARKIKNLYDEVCLSEELPVN